MTPIKISYWLSQLAYGIERLISRRKTNPRGSSSFTSILNSTHQSRMKQHYPFGTSMPGLDTQMMSKFHAFASRQRSGRLHALILLLGLLLLAGTQQATAQDGPVCTPSTAKTTDDGLGSNYVKGVFAIGSTVYAATYGGLSISTNGGGTFTNITTGLGSTSVNGAYAISGSGSTTVYAATNGGLSISTNGGGTFTNITAGLGSTIVNGVYAVSGPGSTTVYAATNGGLSISTDGGSTFTNITTGLANNTVKGVYAVGSTIYAATNGGLSVSTDGGANFTTKVTGIMNGVYAVGNNVYVASGSGVFISTDGGANFTAKTTTDGLASVRTNSVYAIGNTVYAATQSGLSISTNGGNSFTTYGNPGTGVIASGNIIYRTSPTGLFLCSTALPVSLLYFNGRATPQGNLLEWKTTQEADNAGFTILRGSSPTSLEIIGAVSSQAPDGNAAQPLAYSFLDNPSLAGLNYYQLLQTDFSGQKSRSAIIAIRSDDKSPVLFPNPTPLSGILCLEPPQAYDRYELIDASGKTIQAVEQPGTLNQLSLPTGAQGIYWLRLQNAGMKQVYRIIK